MYLLAFNNVEQIYTVIPTTYEDLESITFNIQPITIVARVFNDLDQVRELVSDRHPIDYSFIG